MYTTEFEDEFMTDMEAEADSDVWNGVIGDEKGAGGDNNSVCREERIVIQQDTAHLEKRGSADGVVLSLTQKGDGFYDVFYTLDVNLGTPPAVFPLLLDTGSSDLWVAAPQCSCASPSYDPTTSSTITTLSQSLDATYLSGSLSGPIYTDTFSLGPYVIPHQAFCGAEQVENESMGLGFSGIVGLGLEGMSLIESVLSGNGSVDGATVLNNLFDPTVVGVGNVPSQRWFSLVLDRPGFDDDDSSNTTSTTTSLNSTTPSSSSTSPGSTTTPFTWSHNWPARLGIGAHVDEVAQAFALAHPTTSSNSTSALQAALVPLPLTPATNGEYTHWKTRLSGITVYQSDGNTNSTVGNPTDVRLSRGVDGGAFPVAVLDSGGANVLASRTLADAVYGVWGIGMGDDGTYYVPCTLVMNITITLATAPPIPVHPLDMSTYVHNDPTTNTCVGTIQVSSQLGTPGGPADIALGISFLRNVYTVHQLDTPASGTGTSGADSTTPTPRLSIAPLTNPTLALTEFHNVRVLNLSPNGQAIPTPPMSGSSSESLGTLSKVGLGVGLFILACILLFASRWIVLRRRFNERRRRGLGSHTVSEMGHSGKWGAVDGMIDGAAEWADVIRRKTTLRTKKKKAKEKAALGGWKEVSEVGHETGLAGHVATKSAVGHGSIRRKDKDEDDREASEAFDQIMRDRAAGGVPMGGSGGGDRRSAELRQGSGPFAGFSLWTFVGAKRLLGPRSGQSDHGGRYELTPNPGSRGHVDLLDEGDPTEDQLRERRFAAHKRRTGTGRENESSVWSDVTWVERGDGTLIPSGTTAAGGAGTGKQGNLQYNEFGERKTYGYVGTPNETVVGSTTHLVGGAQGNSYGFPKDIGSDDESTERASTLHGSPEFGHVGKGGRAGRGSHSRSSSAGREALPLLGAFSSGMGMASTSSLGGATLAQGMGHANHRSVPSLELNHPPRLDSSGIITASPYPMTGTPGEHSMPFGPFGTPPRMVSGTPPSGTPPRLSATPPGIPATPPRIPSTPPANSKGFDPFVIPTTIHTQQPPQQHQPTLVHPARERAALAMEPNLSPLTEVNSSEFPPSTSNRMSIMSALNPGAAAQNANEATGAGPDRRSLERLERQSSIGALSMESEVLVPLPISLMNLPRSRYSPPPMETISRPAERRWEDPVPTIQRVPDFGRPPVSVTPPPPLPPKKDASRTLPVQKSAPMAHPLATSFTLPAQSSSNPFYPPIIPATAPLPAKQSSTPPRSSMPRSNNPFDMLALGDFGLKDSRFPSREALSLGTKDSRFPAFTPPSSNVPSRPAISLNTRSSSADPIRSTFVAVPDEAARPRLRMRGSETELPRPQSEAIRFGAEQAGGLPGRNGGAGGKDVEKPWMKPRSQSGGAASLPSMTRPGAPNQPVQPISRPAAPPAMLDFAPPHNYQPTRPEQRTLPIMGTTREEPRPALPSRVSEPASSSMGMRSRGPRPMVAGPRSLKSSGSPSTPGSTHSPPSSPPSAGIQSASVQSRHDTNNNSPLSSTSASASSTAFSSSLPPGARAPTDPRLHSHHQLPSIPRTLSSSSMPVPGASNPPPLASPANSPPAHPRSAPIPIPSTHHGMSQHPASIARESSAGTTEEDPEAAYGGMAEYDAPQVGWRGDAARTAGVAGVGARSRFTGPMNPYTSPFDDRS